MSIQVVLTHANCCFWISKLLYLDFQILLSTEVVTRLSHDQVALFKTFRDTVQKCARRTINQAASRIKQASYNCSINYCTVENCSRITPSNMVLRPLFNTETTLIWYCYHSIMVLRPLKYGVTTILIINFSNYDTMITQIWFYTILASNFFKNRRRIYFKIIHNFEGTLYQ